MKKILSLILCVVMVMSMFALASCDNNTDTNNGDENKATTLKFGFAVDAAVSAVESATADKEGKGEFVVNAAAVLVDAEGKIVKCVLDTADNTVNFTAEGKAVEVSEFKTKYEMGDAYGMVAYAGAAKEWYEQADAFCAAVVGKTAAEVKALVADNDYAQGALVEADCTIKVGETYRALEKAVNSAVAFEGNGTETIKLGLNTEATIEDATADADGSAEVNTTMFAALLDKDGKILDSFLDAAQIQFGFTAAGKSTTDTETAFRTKYEKHGDYAMGGKTFLDKDGDGVVLEWDAQADAFNSVCVGKTLTQVVALALENDYGVEELVNVDCTIKVGEFTRAASKAR